MIISTQLKAQLRLSHSYLKVNYLLWKPLEIIRLCIKLKTAWVKQPLVATSSDSKPENRCCSTRTVQPWWVIIRCEWFGKVGVAFREHLRFCSFPFCLFLHFFPLHFLFPVHLLSSSLPSLFSSFFVPLLSLCVPWFLLFSFLLSQHQACLISSSENQQLPLCRQKHLCGCYGYSLRYNYYSNAVSEGTRGSGSAGVQVETHRTQTLHRSTQHSFMLLY